MDEPQDVQTLLSDLLRYEEILGVVAVSVEGLVMGAAGISGDDVDMAAALGASLIGATERTTRRLSAGAATNLSITTPEGMIHLRNAGDFALVVFSEMCDPTLVTNACEETVRHFSEVLSPA